MIEIARIRCAEAHQATAWTRLVWTQTSSKSSPRIASTSMVSRKSVLSSKDIYAGPIVRKTHTPQTHQSTTRALGLRCAHSTNGERRCVCVGRQDHGYGGVNAFVKPRNNESLPRCTAKRCTNEIGA